LNNNKKSTIEIFPQDKKLFSKELLHACMYFKYWIAYLYSHYCYWWYLYNIYLQTIYVSATYCIFESSANISWKEFFKSLFLWLTYTHVISLPFHFYGWLQMVDHLCGSMFAQRCNNKQHPKQITHLQFVLFRHYDEQKVDHGYYSKFVPKYKLK
jgi:hypothetical protein